MMVLNGLSDELCDPQCKCLATGQKCDNVAVLEKD